MKSRKILFVFGTRPEAIKFAPLIHQCRKTPGFETVVCVTAQHREMLDQVLSFFEITPDHDLNLMKPGQDLFDVTAGVLTGMKKIYEQVRPDLVFVQGDTTTVFAAALASFYLKIPVAHLEAGLRSHNSYSPFPEEINRILAGNLSFYHFAPTKGALENLRQENITENVFNVGNTVIDALHLARKIICEKADVKKRTETELEKLIPGFFSMVSSGKKIILVTGHRRESFGGPFVEICQALKKIALRYPEVKIIYPVHLNPNVQKPVNELLSGISNVFLIPPVEYPLLVTFLENCYFVLTDSGGIQEEAPALGKPVLVMRDVTERMEGVIAGTAKLVGTSEKKIFESACELLDDNEFYKKMALAVNPYGDGHTSEKIMEILSRG